MKIFLDQKLWILKITRGRLSFCQKLKVWTNKKKSGVALAQLSLTLHYGKRKFYDQLSIHIYTLISLFCTCFHFHCLQFFSSNFARVFIISANNRFFLNRAGNWETILQVGRSGKWEVIFPTGRQKRNKFSNCRAGQGWQKINEFFNGRAWLQKEED